MVSIFPRFLDTFTLSGFTVRRQEANVRIYISNRGAHEATRMATGAMQRAEHTPPTLFPHSRCRRGKKKRATSEVGKL